MTAYQTIFLIRSIQTAASRYFLAWQYFSTTQVYVRITSRCDILKKDQTYAQAKKFEKFRILFFLREMQNTNSDRPGTMRTTRTDVVWCWLYHLCHTFWATPLIPNRRRLCPALGGYCPTRHHMNSDSSNHTFSRNVPGIAGHNFAGHHHRHHMNPDSTCTP